MAPSLNFIFLLTDRGAEIQRNPAYQTSASLIPSFSNPSYAAHSTINCVRMRMFRICNGEVSWLPVSVVVSYEDEVSSCVVSTDVFTSCSTRWSPESRSR